MKILDVIQYEGNNKTFIWRHPSEDFNTGSQLIVHDTQEAILYADGCAQDLFTSGKYKLSTKNIPFLSKIRNIPYDGVSPFHCQVYFINKTEQMAIPWGVGDVIFNDSLNNNYAFKIGASGEMSIRVSDSKKLINKLVGTETINSDGTMFDQETLKKYFKSPIISLIKSIIPSLFREKGTSIFHIEEDLVSLAQIIKDRVSLEMSDYGISLEKLNVETVKPPESDPFYISLNSNRARQITVVQEGEIGLTEETYNTRRGIIAHEGEVRKGMMDTDAKKYDQEMLGYTYGQQQMYGVLQAAASNPGTSADVTGAFMGMGMGMNMGNTIGNQFGNMMDVNMGNNWSGQATTPYGGTVHGEVNLKAEADLVGSENFGTEVLLAPIMEKETVVEPKKRNIKERMQDLADMKEMGYINDEEFELKREEILNDI